MNEIEAAKIPSDIKRVVVRELCDRRLQGVAAAIRASKKKLAQTESDAAMRELNYWRNIEGFLRQIRSQEGYTELEGPPGGNQNRT